MVNGYGMAKLAELDMDKNIIYDAFKTTFKYYKSLKSYVYPNQIVDVDKQSNVVLLSSHLNQEDNRLAVLGLKEMREWKTYSFTKHPGLYLIRNPFTNLGQRYWITRCLEDYPKKPNRINIDIDRDNAVIDWWAECFKKENCDIQLQKKLRWTTLGYHHNWDTKVYAEENRSEFPSDLAELSDVVACYIGYNNYEAQAAIVNYYHMDSTLSAHTDHSEVNLEAPLLSFSFGQSAIFLIGGQDKSTEPSAILLQSGDIVIMSEEARLCYHAVPKIIPACSTPWDNSGNILPQDGVNTNLDLKYIKNENSMLSALNKNFDKDWNCFKEYIQSSRININVRQVLHQKQDRLHQKFNT